MLEPLQDSDGELTRQGRVVSRGGLILCVASGLATLPVLLLLPLLVLSGSVLAFSPFVLLFAALHGWSTYRNPTWSQFGWAVAASITLAAGFILFPFRG